MKLNKNALSAMKMALVLACLGLFSTGAGAQTQAQRKQALPIIGEKMTGVVVDMDKLPLPGVNIVLKGTQVATVSDGEGKFEFAFDKTRKTVLVFSFMGMKTQEIEIKSADLLTVTMEEDVSEMEDIVVTGIYSRVKESFTGSSQTYSNEELKSIGTHNIIRSLSVLDPAFNLLESKEYGSDPNRLPDIEIRGKSSIVGLQEEYGQDPNQPLFVLDGFITSLSVIMDLNMDRVASVTILKDAASTAIYGSQAANGVVVVETKAPAHGRLRLSYSGSSDLTWADLTDYNLMNAEEKLEFERLSGVFESTYVTTTEQLKGRYNKLLQDVRRGVDSYWMSEPLRLGVNHRHNVYAEGGDNQMRYGLGVNYSGVMGVMKNSNRDVMGMNLDLIYRKGKFNVMNKVSLDWTDSGNPMVAFSEYSKANPYYEKRTPGGGVERYLEDWYVDNFPGYDYGTIKVQNPLYNDAQNSYNKGTSLNIRDNFSAEYRPVSYLTLRARVGITKRMEETENFNSPNTTQFDNVDSSRKGRYSNNRGDGMSYDTDLTATYGQLFADKHMVNIAAGMSFSESNSISKGFTAEGFPEGNFIRPSFASQFSEGTKPSYSESKYRRANFYINGGYAYKNKYLMDFNLRSDGTSVFGANKRFSTTWAFGLGWNIHKEEFFQNLTDIINVFKIRGSVGNPGNQNFGAFGSITTYYFNNWLLNDFGTGLLVSTFGDPDMEIQRTIDKNIGLNLSMFKNRFHLTFDFYNKRTDPLIASLGLPLSVGVTSRRTNIGVQVDQGMNGSIRYAILYKPKERINWTMSLNFRTGKSHYEDIGKALDQYNRENLTKNMVRYYDGGSSTALWAVRSRGIDPATGREIFVKKNGTLTYNFDYDDQVEVGNTRPVIAGVYGNSFMYKGLSVSVQLRYSYGADVFNRTLFNKVENISTAGIRTNQDKRALYDRWKKPGDMARYKDISLTESTPMSSRFVMEENYLSIESVRLGYQFTQRWLRNHLHISSLNLSAYMNSIGRFSTIEDERGLSYPFARSVSFSLGLTL